MQSYIPALVSLSATNSSAGMAISPSTPDWNSVTIAGFSFAKPSRQLWVSSVKPPSAQFDAVREYLAVRFL